MSGSRSKAGQPLMRIDETDLRLALTAKRNAVLRLAPSWSGPGRRATLRRFGQERFGGTPAAL
jgi:multidrug efflux pump subunit AcrA (membrane-fusion protein)